MARKTAFQKLETKIHKMLLQDDTIKEHKGKVKVRNKLLFEYSEKEIKYTTTRYFPTKKDDLTEQDFKVIIPLNNENIKILSSNIVNPPKGAKTIIDLVRKTIDENINLVVIGSRENIIESTQISITQDLYDTILKVDKEEGIDKTVRFKNRAIPFLQTNFHVDIDQIDFERDYSLLLKEILASGEYTQLDLLSLISNLETGDINNIVIEKQINKQVEWLIETIQEIIDEPSLTKQKAKDLGYKYFNFSKCNISGPEHLMEMIITRYGKHTLLGVPVLLNTDKYVIHKKGLSRSQFDIILVNHLKDIEVVELKRPDEIVLDYDEGRNKFFASKNLSIAISQAERYISAVYRENDENYLINGQKIHDYLNSEIGGVTQVDICRPTALIIIGNYQTLAKNYNELKESTKNKISRNDYDFNCYHAYKELKNAFKNIKILTYSELLENARIRLLQHSEQKL